MRAPREFARATAVTGARAFTLGLITLTLLGGAAFADGPVSAAASVDRRGITIGDPIELTLVVETDAGYQITDNGIGRTMGEFEAQESRPPQLAKLQGGRTRYTFHYRITAFRVGGLALPRISVAYKGPSGDSGVAPTEEIPILVTSVIQPGEDPTEIKPLKPQLRLPGAPAQVPAIVVQSALAAVVLVVLVLLIRQTRRAAGRAPAEGEPQLTPAQHAMAELNRVAALKLPEKGRYAEHYALVTLALRAYVRDRFGLSATERTPGELRDDMLRAGIDRTEIATIYDILREGENARFHPVISYPARAHHAVRAALEAMRRAAVAEQYDLMQRQPS